MSLAFSRELDFEGCEDLSEHIDAAIKLYRFSGALGSKQNMGLKMNNCKLNDEAVK